VFKEPRVNTKV